MTLLRSNGTNYETMHTIDIDAVIEKIPSTSFSYPGTFFLSQQAATSHHPLLGYSRSGVGSRLSAQPFSNSFLCGHM